MKKYKELCRTVLAGARRPNRTGVDAVSVFGCVLDVALDPFPLLTTKRVWWRGVVEELLWFLRGSQTTEDLNSTIWDEWGPNVGPIYGYQWRNWGGDQVLGVIRSLRENPYGRRHIISAWNVGALHLMALPPCHMMVQFYVSEGQLSAQMYQRSADVFLGVPFNISSYALLTYMIAQQVGLGVGRLRICFGDAHIYVNHLDQIQEQLERPCRELPTLELAPKDIDAYTYDDCKIVGYSPHPRLRGDVAV